MIQNLEHERRVRKISRASTHLESDMEDICINQEGEEEKEDTTIEHEEKLIRIDPMRTRKKRGK